MFETLFYSNATNYSPFPLYLKQRFEFIDKSLLFLNSKQWGISLLTYVMSFLPQQQEQSC